MIVPVTQIHIDKGGKERNNNPIALALRDAKPNCKRAFASIAKSGLRVEWEGGFGVSWDLPSQVKRWLKKWENGGKCKPFSFRI